MVAHSTKYKQLNKARFFADKQCVECGSTDNLELDHIDPSTKDQVLKDRRSTDIWRWSKKRLDEELAKCQILCHSCHRKKTLLNRENGLRGSKHSQAKLTEDDVFLIRQMALDGYKQTVISTMFNVSYSQVNRIVNRKKWTHI